MVSLTNHRLFMNNKIMYEPIIGLEVHLQPKTKSKMFCSCSTEYFHKAANSLTCPVCLGLPGALPVPNKLAIEKCIMLGLALNCKIRKDSKFDRKNYFYPDLPKGYQISQYDLPFCYEGVIPIEVDGDVRMIRITRIHMEEDTGKSQHEAENTFLDYNKSGMPLIELVSEPDFVEMKEVTSFAKRFRQLVRYLGISDADMEKGQLRFELNMSLREVGQKGLPNYKVEVKNIGSISVLEKVIAFEFERQEAILKQGKNPPQETRGVKDATGETLSQRIKEEADDYRYFPEPDIPPIHLSDDLIADIKGRIGELPYEKKDRFISELGLEPSMAETLTSSKSKAEWFEQAIQGEKDKAIIAEIAKWFIGDVFSMLKADKLKLRELKFAPKQLAELIRLLKGGKLSGTLTKQVLKEMYETGKDPEGIMSEQGLVVVSDDSQLTEIAKQVITANPKVVDNYAKNPNVIKFLVGQMMRETKGKADPNKSEAILKGLLG